MKISVCMAAYNGSKYIAEQISSILMQINSDDELIIVNDCSDDHTIEVIQSFNDRRIKVIHNPINLGLIKSFEISLSNSSGEIIFLSDQDDIWMPDKVKKTVEHMQNKNASAVVSDAIVVDQDGNILYDSFFKFRNSGSGIIKNFYKNSYIGCCMAITSKFKKHILPFPKDIIWHDEWIGFTYEFLDRVEFIPEKLVQYRRHSSNQTNMHRQSLINVFLKRLKLVKIMAVEFFKISFGLR
jgi:glycosyltransferase involved in cell wall biosynthesis